MPLACVTSALIRSSALAIFVPASVTVPEPTVPLGAWESLSTSFGICAFSLLMLILISCSVGAGP